MVSTSHARNSARDLLGMLAALRVRQSKTHCIKFFTAMLTKVAPIVRRSDSGVNRNCGGWGSCSLRGTFGGGEEEVLTAVVRTGGQALGAVGDLGDMLRLPRVHPRHRERQG